MNMQLFDISIEKTAIEPTLNDNRIQEIIPIRHQAYASLRAIQIAGEPLTRHIQKIYDNSSDMEAFLDAAYCFLEKGMGFGWEMGEIPYDNYLSKCPSVTSENLDIVCHACNFLLCGRILIRLTYRMLFL